MRAQGLEHLEAGLRLVAERLLREEDAERRGLSALGDGGRRMFERASRPRPELEPRKSAGLLDGVRELRALLDERLVDDHENVLSRLQPAGVDQVPAPAAERVGHPRILATEDLRPAQ